MASKNLPVSETVDSALFQLIQAVNKNNDLLNAHVKLLHDLQEREEDEDALDQYRNKRENEQVTVAVRVAFLKIGDIDTIKQQFMADIFIEGRWREPALNDKTNEELESMDLTNWWHPRITVLNLLEVLDLPDSNKTWFRATRDPLNPNVPTVIYNRRLKALFYEKLELENFPVDVQDLTVSVSTERAMHEIKLKEDKNNISTVTKDTFLDSQEFDLYEHVEVAEGVTIQEFTKKNFEHPYLDFQIKVARKSGYFFWNVFFIMLLIILMTFATYAIDASRPQSRLGVTLTLLLTAVAFKMVIAQNLPTISYLTYLDKYVIFSLCFLCAQAIQNAVVSIFTEKKDFATAEIFDKICILAFAVVLFSFHVYYFVNIYIRALRERRELRKKDEEYKKRKATTRHKSRRGKDDSVILPGTENDTNGKPEIANKETDFLIHVHNSSQDPV